MRLARLICPASGIVEEKRAGALATAARLAEAVGWRVEIGASALTAPQPGAWLPLELRVDDLAWACRADVVWAARGGYGCVHLLDRLPTGDLPLLVGFSDLTALHSVWRGRGIYGALPAWPCAERTTRTLLDLLGSREVVLDTLTAVRAGSAEGPLFPHCLRVLAGLVGTPWMPDLDGCILALEDIEEAPYKIDRDLWQLHAAGALRGIRGILGDFAGGTPINGPDHRSVIAMWAERLGVPAAMAQCYGHRDDHACLPVGGRATFTVAAQASLIARWEP